MNVPRPISHQQATKWLHRAADQPLNAAEQAQLQQHLRECEACRAYAQNFELLQQHLPRALQDRWGAPSALQTQLALQRLSQRLHSANISKGESRMQKLVSSLAWVMTLVFLVVAFGWLLRNGLPLPASPEPIATPPVTPTFLPQFPTPTVTTNLLPQPTATATTTATIQTTLAFLPQVTFELPAALPENPARIALYRQILPEMVNRSNAQQIVQALQIENATTVMQIPMTGESPDGPFLRLTNGWQEVVFDNFATHFSYTRAPQLPETNNAPLTRQQQIEQAAAYLQQIGLLNQPYRAQAAETDGFGVSFTPLVNNLPVYFSIGMQDEDWLSVSFDQWGAIKAISAHSRDFQPIGDYPLLSAAQAWQRLNTPNGLERARYAVLSPQVGEPRRVWLPTYEPGIPIDLYGYLSVTTLEDGSSPPVVTINNWVLANPPADLLALYAPNARAPIVHLQGIFERNSKGYTQFVAQNWEALFAADMFFTRGYLQRGSETTLLTNDGETLYLPYLPNAIGDASRIEVAGLRDPNQPQILHWYYLAAGDYGYTYQASQTCFGGGGGGGGDENAPLPVDFGGGNLANFTTQPQGNTAPPLPALTPNVAIGTRLDGVGGQLFVQRFVNDQGQSALHYSVWLEADETFPNGASLTLGGNVQGLENYLNMPVNLWGVVTQPDPMFVPPAMPVDVYLNVERYEPAYPNAHLAEFSGTLQRAQLTSGATVVLLTTADAKQYLLHTSLLYGADEAFVGRPGDLIEIEGFLTGDSLDGYPILNVVSAGTSPDGIVGSAQIYDWTPPFDDFGALVSGKITIDTIELAYSGVWLDNCLPQPNYSAEELENWLVLQPIWVFSGRFDDGRLFVVQVQALPDAFLK